MKNIEMPQSVKEIVVQFVTQSLENNKLTLKAPRKAPGHREDRNTIIQFLKNNYKQTVLDIYGEDAWDELRESIMDKMEEKYFAKVKYDNRYNRRVILNETPEDVMESEVKARPVIGNVNEYRLAQLDKIAKEHTWRRHCGHDWDCCGCCFATETRVEKRDTGYFMVQSRHFNY